MQLQTGLWFTTRHSALSPHNPRQGLIHFWFTQARLEAQSELKRHSGRQLGATPIILERQSHWARPETTWHLEFGPHGVGLQGLGGRGPSVVFSNPGRIGFGATERKKPVKIYKQRYEVIWFQPCFLLWIIWQSVRASPVYPEGHTHDGLWLITRHWASIPHVPEQGSTHLKLLHASVGGHSELETHSGRHSGGTPK